MGDAEPTNANDHDIWIETDNPSKWLRSLTTVASDAPVWTKENGGWLLVSSLPGCLPAPQWWAEVSGLTTAANTDKPDTRIRLIPRDDSLELASSGTWSLGWQLGIGAGNRQTSLTTHSSIKRFIFRGSEDGTDWSNSTAASSYYGGDQGVGWWTRVYLTSSSIVFRVGLNGEHYTQLVDWQSASSNSSERGPFSHGDGRLWVGKTEEWTVPPMDIMRIHISDIDTQDICADIDFTRPRPVDLGPDKGTVKIWRS